jgi:hypothetical protein
VDLRQRLIAPFATVSHPGDIISVDLAGFVLRLILFDRYIVQSVRLREFPELISAFGFPAVQELLASGAVNIRCEALTIGQIGQLNLLQERVQKGLLPLGSYSFATISVPNHREYVHNCLQPLHDVEGLSERDVKKLKHSIASRLLPPSLTTAADTMWQFHADLRANAPIITTSIAIALGDKIGREVSPDELAVRIHPIDEHDFRAETNIATKFGLGEEEMHRVVEHGLGAVGGLNQRIAEMKEYNALSGFQGPDLPLFEQKLDFIARNISPEVQFDRLRRILVIKGFDDLAELIERREVDLHKVLEIRETTECKEFREWLLTTDSATDAEIQDRIASLREKLSWRVHGTGGKVARWLASTGIGAIPGIGTMLAATLGILDTFLMEKVLPKPGAITFLNKLYPSIFKNR